jgi:hypothetical protein
VSNVEDWLDELSVDYLRRWYIKARDADNHEVHRWSIWRCLIGEFLYDGTTYIIDEGEIFAVAADFLATLDHDISAVPLLTGVTWPAATPAMLEGDFNQQAAAGLHALLMDRQNVTAPAYHRSMTRPLRLRIFFRHRSVLSGICDLAVWDAVWRALGTATRSRVSRSPGARTASTSMTSCRYR